MNIFFGALIIDHASFIFWACRQAVVGFHFSKHFGNVRFVLLVLKSDVLA
jgi:hypothetical protein